MTYPLEMTTPMAGSRPDSDLLAGRPAIATPLAQDRTVRWARRALDVAARSWFAVAVLGQLMFVVYVVGFFGRAAVLGQFGTWNKVLPRGYIPGDTVGNLIVSMHLVFAAFITVGGALQLTTGVRRLFPMFHRWNGRAYLLSAFVMSLGGLVMVWTRGGPGGQLQHVAISINALLILLCGAMALRHALARRFDMHRRWALRLFLVVSGVWFFRIGLMLWIVVNRGPVGFDPVTFSGPFLTILSFAQYLLPLAVLELYFRAQRSTMAGTHAAMAASLMALTLVTAGGVAAATMLMWLPRL